MPAKGKKKEKSKILAHTTQTEWREWVSPVPTKIDGTVNPFRRIKKSQVDS